MKQRSDWKQLRRLMDLMGMLMVSIMSAEEWLCGFRKSFEEASVELKRALELNPDLEDIFFWKGLVLAYLGKEEEAKAAIEKSLELRLPPALLTPLRWIEKDRPDFYNNYVVQLLAHYEL